MSLKFRLVGLAALLVGGACGSDDEPMTPPQSTPLAQALFVAHEGFLASYDVATGNERAGTLPNVTGPVDLQALADGTLLVNLTGRNELLILDGKTMLERARLPSSSKGAARPVHSYLSPEVGGKRYWFTFNDGAENMPATNSALLVDVTPGSPKYLQAVGEVALGVGHHKAAFSTTMARVAISNISDCMNVVTVYDFTDPANIKSLATLTSKDAGWDGSSFPKTCDPTYKMGVPPAPHGCATSKVSKKAYCNITGSGDIVAVDLDAPAPAFKLIPTTGSGGGYTKASRDGRYLFSLQSSPREGDMKKPGALCQVGQLVVVDAQTDTAVKQLPLLYKGPGCAEALAMTPAETDEPGHLQISPDGKTLFVAVGGGFMVAAARSNQHLVVDISDPANAVQKASLTVGQGTGHRADVLSGDGKFVFVTNNVDGTVTQIDAASAVVVKTIKTKDQPLTVATWGTTEGPSEQTGPIH
jgi:YVTN family beta-propeller protein